MELLHKALALRDRYALREISTHGLAVATGRIEAAMDELLLKTYRTPANRRLAKHLRHEQPWLFTFLHCFGIDATNNAGEREMRPAVIARKTWGGNRTEAGAHTHLSATHMDLPSGSISTALVDPHVLPSGIFAQFSTVRYGLG